jgi:flagellar basal-body rod modification protein FlgD
MTIQSTSPFSTPAAAPVQDNPAVAPVISGATPTQSTFLQLLVAQLKNQDPSTPSDPTQFVSELAQFSQLEQTIQIRTDADAINKSLTPAVTADTSSQVNATNK